MPVADCESCPACGFDDELAKHFICDFPACSFAEQRTRYGFNEHQRKLVKLDREKYWNLFRRRNDSTLMNSMNNCLVSVMKSSDFSIGMSAWYNGPPWSEYENNLSITVVDDANYILYFVLNTWIIRFIPNLPRY